MSGRNIEPFPRGTLVANSGSDTEYYSDPYDCGDAESLAYSVQVDGAFPQTVTDPVIAYIETSSVLNFGTWVNLTPGGIQPQIGTPLLGEVTGSLRWARVRMVVLQGEAATVAVALVCRAMDEEHA
jgi:hypothetical protein